jgi:putative ABC transport system permease protein
MMTKEPSEVVGVVREVKTRELDASEADSETTVYAPAAQFAFGGATLVVRTSVEPDSLARPVALAVRVIDPEQPVLDIATMDSLMEQALGQRPVAMLLLALFAGLAVLLASVGVYSVLAYSVRQRVREIGIRMALGAPVSGVLRLIVIEGLKPTVIGIAVGLLLASLLTGLMSTLLYGVGRHDPATFIVVAGLMAIVGLVATIVPAFRATRVDPIVTLRAD